METLSILPPAPSAAAHGAPPLTGGSAHGAARAAAGASAGASSGGFSVMSLEKLLAADVGPRDEVALTSVKIELDVDEPTNRVVATVRDRETGEVLNQFPAESILRNARGIRELLARELDMKV